MIDLQCHQVSASAAPQTKSDSQKQQTSRPSSPSASSSADSYTSRSSPSSKQHHSTQNNQHNNNNNSPTMIPTTIKRERRLASSPMGPNLHQLHQRRSMSPPPLVRHINLINQSIAAATTTTITPTTATKRPASPSGDRNDMERLQMHHQHHHHHHHGHHSHQTGQRNEPASPGYHSSAPSPNSSIASPVSSSSSSSHGCSSGVSSAYGSFCSSSSMNSSPRHQHQQILTPTSIASAAVATSHVALINSKSPPSSSASLMSPNCHFPAAATAPTGQAQISATGPNSASHSSNNCAASNLPHLLDYYPVANQDGLGLSWFHNANSRQSLSLALVSDKMIVAGDISLAEMSRYPVPIMARPPLTVSDLTLENWLQTVSRSQKGIRLNFTSTRTVEPAFRVLARHAEHLKGPLILSADILTRPVCSQSSEPGPQSNGKGRNNQQQADRLQSQQQQQPVDAWTFLMLCRTRFPKSIISIGWCSIDNKSNQPPNTDLYKFEQQPQLPATSQPKATPPANGSSPSADSMFELDLVMEHPALINGALSQHIQQLAAASRQYRHQQQHFQESTPAAQHRLSDQVASNLSQFGRHHHHNHHHHNHHHHQLLSSNGSLNSSSGNSSGSPSPTSPIGHLASISPAQQQQLLSHHLQQQHQRVAAPDSTEQLILAAAVAEQQRHDVTATKQQQWSSLANAMVSVAGSNLSHHHHHHQLDSHRAKTSQHSQQLPLNLNINEADPQHTTSGLGDLAHKIQQSIQRQHNMRLGHSNHQLDSVESVAAAVLANKLFNPTATTTTSQNNAQLNNNWQHVDKKSALGHRLSSSSASSSPAAAVGNLLCVRAPNTTMRNHTQATATTTTTTANNRNDHDSIGYTREMIDKMASLVKEYNLTQPVTFPVEARLLGKSNNSLNELQRLLYQVGLNSTLTIVAQQEDLIKVDDLLTIRKHFATNQILFDIPDELAAELRNELDHLM